MKILVFSTNYLPFIGGAELAIDKIAGHLSDIEFHLIAPRYKGSLPKEETIGNVRVHRVGLGTSFDKFLIPLTGLFKAFSLHKAFKFDASWSMMASQASITAAFFKVFHRRMPLVLTLQEGDEEEYLKRYAFGSDSLYKLFIKPWHTLVFKTADTITVISKHLEARARANNRSVPIVLVPNGVDLKFFEGASRPEARAHARREFGFSESDLVVATVSRLVEKNRVDTIIRAIAALPVSYKLLVAGTGHLESELKRLAEELGVLSRVVFAGRVEPNDVSRILSAADVFARPSASEGFGSAFLEAMAASVPVIATPVGGITDFVTDKETGLFCEVGDPSDLARKITVLTRDHILRAEIVERALKMVHDRYGWSSVARSMQEQVFKVFLEPKRKKILIATGIYPPDMGGPAQYAKNLLDVWRREGHLVSVHHFQRIRWIPSGFRHLYYLLRLIPDAYTADYIFIPDTFSAAVPAVFLGRLLGKKTIIRTGGDFLWEQYVERTGDLVLFRKFYVTRMNSLNIKERAVFYLVRYALKNAGLVVFSTDWQREVFIPAYGIKKERTALVENYFGPRLQSLPYAQKNFIASGRSLKWKNAVRVKEAFAVALKRGADVIHDDKKYAHEAFLEHVRSSFAVIVATLGDISPNTILDSIRAGKPFIVTRETGITERIKDIAVFVDPEDVKDIADKVCWLSKEENYRMQEKKVAAFSFTHSWEQIAGEFLSLFSKL